MKLTRKNIFMSLFVFSITLFSVMAMYGEKVIVTGTNLVWVSHTEYWSNEEGQSIVRIQDYRGSPISANWCNVTIYYPNKTVFVLNQSMTQGASAGNWWYNFTTPNIMGIYEEFVNCSYGTPEKFVATTESFHMNPALNATHYINETVTDIKTNVTAIKNDTTYIVTNMVNYTAFDDWKDNATNQFEGVKTNLTLEIDNLCDDASSNSSDMCQLLWNLTAYQTAQNLTFTNYFENLTTTTTNTWTYMTTTLFTKLNDTYNIVFNINQTVVAIQENVTAIRQDQVDEINIHIIS